MTKEELDIIEHATGETTRVVCETTFLPDRKATAEGDPRCAVHRQSADSCFDEVRKSEVWCANDSHFHRHGEAGEREYFASATTAKTYPIQRRYEQFCKRTGG